MCWHQAGAWGSAHKTKGLNIYAPEPDSHEAFRAAVTAMCIEALIETGATNTPALAKGEAWLLANLPNVRRSDPTALSNIWSHAYGLWGVHPIARDQFKPHIAPTRMPEHVATYWRRLNIHK